MPLQKLQFRPGIVQDATDYTNEGGWRDGDKIRFRLGLPETIGGWTRLTSTTMLGTCRDLHTWTSLSGTRFVAAGTSLKLYIVDGALPVDITPIRLVTSAGDVTFAATNGSATITVADTAHGCVLDDFVTFSGAASLGGLITAAVLNQEYHRERRDEHCWYVSDQHWFELSGGGQRLGGRGLESRYVGFCS